MIKIPPFESLFLAVEYSSIDVSSISARNVFEERRCGAIWKIGAFSFQGGAENRLNIGGGEAILISCKVHGRVTNRDTGSNPF